MKILVLNAAALHVAYLGCYGNEWVATPALDRLAAEGVVFDQHYVDSLEAPRTCWTGRYRAPDSPPQDPAHTLPALLKGHGVFAAFTNDASLEGFCATLDLVAPFDRWLVWVDLPGLLPPWEVAPEFLQRYFTGEPETLDEGTEDEEELEPLTPLLMPAPGPIDVDDITLLDRLQSTYAAAVTQFDDGVGGILEELERVGMLEDVLILVTADRGLALGEHGIIGDHRPWAHDELIHLPLIVRLPGAEEGGRRVAALTQPVDLLPTLLELFGLPVPPVLGHSLLPLLRGQKEALRPYAVSTLRMGDTEEWAMRTDDWGLVLPIRVPESDAARVPQLYVKPDDRWEANNVVQHHLELAEGLERTLRAFVDAVREGAPLPPLPQSDDV
jgi:arylsulfatase A-like enzyme